MTIITDCRLKKKEKENTLTENILSFFGVGVRVQKVVIAALLRQLTGADKEIFFT